MKRKRKQGGSERTVAAACALRLLVALDLADVERDRIHRFAARRLGVPRRRLDAAVETARADLARRALEGLSNRSVDDTLAETTAALFTARRGAR